MKRIAYLTALAGVAAASAYAAHRAWKHYKHIEQDAAKWRRSEAVAEKILKEQEAEKKAVAEAKATGTYEAQRRLEREEIDDLDYYYSEDEDAA